MAGLLGDGWNDPKSMANMALAAGLLRGDFGQGAAGYGQIMSEAPMNDLKKKMAELQFSEANQNSLDKTQERNKKAQLLKMVEQFRTPAVTQGQFGGTNQVNDALPADLQIGAQQPVQPRQAGFDRQGFGAAYEGIDPIAGFQYQQSIQKDDAPVKLGQGEVLLSGRASGYKPIASAPKQFTTPAAVQEYEYAKANGYIGSYLDFQLAQNKSKATNVNTTVSVAGPENAYNADVGKSLAATGTALVESAKQAPQVVENARMIKAALGNGAITGSGADVRLAVQKAAETFGIVEPGKAATTQQLMAGLGKLTLSGIKTSGLGGGNGFTDKDREFLNAAISGTISDTPENLRRVADLSERVAVATHAKGTQVLNRWRTNPSLAAVAQDSIIDPLPTLNMSPAYPTPKTGNGWSIVKQ